ncbi:hypothetical protein DM860_013153 [Cuscuta australis]|uniref:cytokinin riboside 5'-monophosphate phosphoribohydrolase n=1 Tax=Cuscuta australis TaxID=267555 RepID=A0A328DB89_9ASTE|nr:hypothetical protein DM860_013153 [Cuscuta australis]
MSPSPFTSLYKPSISSPFFIKYDLRDSLACGECSGCQFSVRSPELRAIVAGSFAGKFSKPPLRFETIVLASMFSSAGSRESIYHDYGKSISHSHIMEGTSRTLPYTIRFVGLLGSHSLGRNPKFMATTVDLGRELIRRRISLAYGGGNVGLQRAVASTVFTNGGLVRGFIPGYIATRRVYGPTYDVEHTVSSNYYKYFEMNHAVEAFIILPGGVDTMEGLFTLISWASEGLHNRPIGLLNIDGYFNNLLKFLDSAVRQNFMASSQRKLFISSFFVDELLKKLEFAKAFPDPRASYDNFVNPRRLDLELHL